MPKADPAQRQLDQIDQITRRLCKRVDSALKAFVRSSTAILRRAATGRKSSDRKSTPEQVRMLQDRIVMVLRRATGPMQAQKIFLALSLKTADAGRFNYALDTLKRKGTVRQIGSRRVARYEVPRAAA